MLLGGASRLVRAAHEAGKELRGAKELPDNEMKPRSHGQDGGSRLISVLSGP